MLHTTHIEKIKRLLLVTIGVMAASMAYYVWRYNTVEKVEITPISMEQVSSDADVLASNVELTEIVGERILWILQAKQAKVYNDRKETWLKDVEVEFYDETGQKSLHLVSDEGTKSDKSGNVVATGNVQATSFVEGIILKTSELMYDAGINKIVSDKHVIIERGNLITSGDGLESNLSLTEARILRNVTTSFVSDDLEE
ncbi:MAG: LPS export ABC transporter periplasmic protein LptC [bacterium]|nr:LPS export ABC transporter periplasmic protein LptC [bacterium]